ncbi:MAG: tetratricopeptide repeat protein [Pseudomonadales bacterium]
MNKNFELVSQATGKPQVDNLVRELLSSDQSADNLLEITYLLLTEKEGYEYQARKVFQRCLEVNPQYTKQAIALTNIPKVASNIDACKGLLTTALQYSPNSIEITNCLACLLTRCGEFKQAEQLFCTILEHNKHDYRVLINLCDLYYRINRNHEAIACAQLAVELAPNEVAANFNCAIALIGSARYTEAVTFLEKTLALDPNNDSAILNLSNLLLKSGNFEKGWTYAKQRWSETNCKYKIPLPFWRGESLTKKGLIIWHDRGLGDQIMYAGLFQRLLDTGCHLGVICDKRLENIYRDSFKIDNIYSHNEGDPLDLNIQGNYHYHTSMGTLPAYLLHSFADFDSSNPYLIADDKQSQLFKKEFQSKFPDKKVIGFSWRGGIKSTRKHARDTGLNNWQKLLSNPDYQFINLQYDSTLEENRVIENMGGYIPNFDCKNDIDSLAALLKALDLVISADNTTVHLAGALGVPIWTLAPYSSDWRWFFEVEKTYWYQSMMLIHQTDISDWTNTFCIVEEKMNKLINQGLT